MSHLKATTFEELNAIVSRGKGYRDNCPEAVIGNNTRARRIPDGAIIISLHHNDIVLLDPNGETFFSLAGWATRTTLDRVNQFLPWERTEGPGFYGSSTVRIGLSKWEPFVHITGAVHYDYSAFGNRPSNWKTESKAISSNRWYSVSPLMSLAKSKMADAMMEEFAGMVSQ